VSEASLPEILVHYPEVGVALVLLNRPDAINALSLSLQPQLAGAFTTLTNDAAVRVIVLSGSDKVFAAGGDIRSLAEPARSISCSATRNASGRP
jgi:enoyl-CoA hydratase/carnithine racemase